jgi:hypothetical protein
MSSERFGDGCMRHFDSRSRNLQACRLQTGHYVTPVQVFVQYDQGCPNSYDLTDFRYTGTSPEYTKFDIIQRRNRLQQFMKSGGD